MSSAEIHVPVQSKTRMGMDKMLSFLLFLILRILVHLVRRTCTKQVSFPPPKPNIESYFTTFSQNCFIR